MDAYRGYVATATMNGKDSTTAPNNSAGTGSLTLRSRSIAGTATLLSSLTPYSTVGSASNLNQSFAVGTAYTITFTIMFFNACCLSKNLKKPKDSFKCLFQVYGMLLIILQHILILPIIESFFLIFSGQYTSDRTSSESVAMSVTAAIFLTLILGLVVLGKDGTQL